MSYKPTIYTAFANNWQWGKDYLPNLSHEAAAISDLFQQLAFADKLYYMKDELFNMTRMITNFSKYGRRFDVFYFSGHGQQGCLKLFGDFIADIERLSDLIVHNLSQVRLIFLNACETFELARKVVLKYGNKPVPVFLAFGGTIDSFLAEQFACHLLFQIGQPGDFYEAYTQAKSLINLPATVNLTFREFNSRESVADCTSADFDVAFIEIPFVPDNYKDEGDGEDQSLSSGKSKKLPMIQTDQLTRDVLTTNYLNNVVKSVSKANDVDEAVLPMLMESLEKAKSISVGQLPISNYNNLFARTAKALPGISSGNVFKSLINTDQHLKSPFAQQILKTEESVIDQMTDVIKNAQRVNLRS